MTVNQPVNFKLNYSKSLSMVIKFTTIGLIKFPLNVLYVKKEIGFGYSTNSFFFSEGEE